MAGDIAGCGEDCHEEGLSSEGMSTVEVHQASKFTFSWKARVEFWDARQSIVRNRKQ
jgi:hypothetical protein